jgi:hypothetical protein
MKNRICIILGFALLSTAIHAQQFQLKWETPAVHSPGIVVYLGHPSLSAGGEFLVVDTPNAFIYDGLTHNVKWTFQIHSVRGGFYNGFQSNVSLTQDYNGNGARDFFYDSIEPTGLSLVDPGNGTVLHKFSSPGDDYSPICLDDVDADGKLELVIYKFTFSSTTTSCIQVYSTVLSLTSVSNVTPAAPNRFHLDQNYPNPFNPSTIIQYSLPKEGHATIQIFNLSGQRVRTLLNERKNSGEYSVNWDGKTDIGSQASSGTYFYVVTIGGLSEARKMLLLR